VLEEHNLPYTIFLTTNFITQDNTTFMSWGHVKELARGNLASLGAHCKNHVNLRALEIDDKVLEIMRSKTMIEEQTGKVVNTCAYPGGGYDEQSLDVVSKNFLLGFKDRYSDNDEDRRKIARISIDSRHNNFRSFLVELARTPFLGAKS
jgi:peptidoglycan/xylan/chitin deacetylase (PgdA/CDA1 family)